ncbi:hydroxyacylglutathione hydrolase [Salinisphaera dokdonensis CL-ES53]|uniref:Hydroxyacylglutathione hydrolase n=1 Tax=Salinisphaera dokdonensis CL-ES53 TaxID=1304272 RepID=A0ABV2B459_9GAMM
MLEITALSALSDNYIWVIANGGDTTVAVVDPGEAAPVQQYLSEHGLAVGAYLITHHHGDHVGGLDALLAEHPAPVYGPRDEADRVAQITDKVAGGDQFSLAFLDADFDVIDVPGHTLGHIAYVTPGALLAGDALFRGGCGRVFEGTHAQMQASLARLRDLPESTQVYGGHEYTLKNLAFAQTVEPGNAAIEAVINEVNTLRADDRPSLPGTIAEEREINPFLRWDHPDVVAAAEQRAGRSLSDPGEIFATLREWKDAS